MYFINELLQVIYLLSKRINQHAFVNCAVHSKANPKENDDKFETRHFLSGFSQICCVKLSDTRDYGGVWGY